MNRRKIIPEAIQRRLTKFFVSNLPDRCSGSDIAGGVRQYGEIFDIYIARKRDKGGNRFGFVSMLDVKDKVEMKNMLSSIRLGAFSLKFNVARFVLEDGEIGTRNQDQRQPNKNGTDKGVHRDSKAPGYIATGRSYKETLMGNSNNNVKTRLIKINNKVQAFKDLHGKAFVARMIDMDALKNIRSIVKKINPSGGRVQYLCGFRVLISYNDRKTTIDAMESAKSIFGRFSHICLWEGQSLGFERLAWLKNYGLPMHLLHNDVIHIVCN